MEWQDDPLSKLNKSRKSMLLLIVVKVLPNSWLEFYFVKFFLDFWNKAKWDRDKNQRNHRPYIDAIKLENLLVRDDRTGMWNA